MVGIRGRTMPLWAGIICIFFAVASLGYSLLAYAENHETPLPFIGEITYVSPDFAVLPTSHLYNLTTYRYDKIVFSIVNDGAAVQIKIYVKMYNASNILIAEGVSATLLIPAGPSTTPNCDVVLTWVPSFTAKDLMGGRTDYQGVVT